MPRCPVCDNEIRGRHACVETLSPTPVNGKTKRQSGKIKDGKKMKSRPNEVEMAKAKITMIIEVEYVLDPNNYFPRTDTDEKRLQSDVKDLRENPEDIFIIPTDADLVVTVTGSVIP